MVREAGVERGGEREGERERERERGGEKTRAVVGLRLRDVEREKGNIWRGKRQEK